MPRENHRPGNPAMYAKQARVAIYMSVVKNKIEK